MQDCTPESAPPGCALARAAPLSCSASRSSAAERGPVSAGSASAVMLNCAPCSPNATILLQRRQPPAYGGACTLGADHD